jgi:hypothetical protein
MFSVFELILQIKADSEKEGSKVKYNKIKIIYQKSRIIYFSATILISLISILNELF